eukprot:TRINITY_DN23035_c0_g4_i1.p1 TRINITY_DN23035_c0_g4~~TRINITY_DN23035_c0_g4_i1.p1  ORF type:complete len:1183 (-),score=316.86 TRINITY_DN23035_c0_g4_i1:59-3223(-)
MPTDDQLAAAAAVPAVLERHSTTQAISLETLNGDNRDAFYRFIVEKLLPPTRDVELKEQLSRLSASPEELKQGEEAATFCLGRLVNVGPADGKDFEKKIVDLAESILSRGLYLENAVLQILQNFLRHNRTFIREYMKKSLIEQTDVPQSKTLEEDEFAEAATPERTQRMSFRQSIVGSKFSTMKGTMSKSKGKGLSSVGSNDSLESPTEHSSSIERSIGMVKAILFAKAIICNFKEDLKGWFKHMGLAPAFVFSLIQQSSPSMEAREYGLELAISLAVAPDDVGVHRFEVFSPLTRYSHALPHMYVGQTLRYSGTIAFSHWNILPDVITEAVVVCKMMRDRNREVLLKMLAPWFRQFGRVVSSEHSKFLERNGYTYPVTQTLRGLFDITRMCANSSVLSPNLISLWGCLMSDRGNLQLINPAIAHFIIDQYSSTPVLEDRVLLRLFTVHLLRSTDPTSMIEEFMKCLRAYKDEAPSIPEEYLKWQTQREVQLKTSTEELQADENAALEIIGNLVYEHREMFEPYFPILLQNCFTIFLEKNDSAAAEVITAISLHMGQTRFIQKIYHAEDFVALLNSLPESELASQLKSRWCKLSFLWATHAKDPEVTKRSFSIFKQLNSYYNPTVLIRLVLGLYLAIDDNDDSRVLELIKVFVGIPASKHWMAYEWTLLIAAAFSSLTYSKMRVFDQVVDLLRNLLSASLEKKPILVTRLGDLWKFKHRPDKDEEQKMDLGLAPDSAVADVLLRGLTIKQTFEKTLLLSIQFGTVFAESEFIQADNRLVILSTLASLLKLSFALDNAKTVVQALSSQDQRSFELALLLFEKFGSEYRFLVEVVTDVRSRIAAILQSKVTRDSILSSQLMREESKIVNNDAVCSEMMELLKDGISIAFEALVKTFPKREHFDYMFRVLKEFLFFGEPDWRRGILWMFGVFLAHSEFKCSPDQFSDVIELLVQNYYSTDDNLSESAESIASFIIQSAPPSVSTGFFNFIRKRIPRGRPRRLSGIEKVSGADLAKQLAKDKEECLAKFERYVFTVIKKAVSDGETKQDLDDKFESKS